MIFKNIIPYILTEEISDLEKLPSLLLNKKFQPCPTHSESSQGWFPPAYTEELVYKRDEFILLCLQKEEKIMPSASINKLVNETVAVIEAKEDRAVSNKQRSSIKDEIIFEKLPTALTRMTKTYGYIDIKSKQIIVGAVSHTKAEEFLSFLRKTLGSLPVVPITADLKLLEQMTNWAQNGSVAGFDEFSFGDECVLVDSEDDRQIRCKNVDITSEDVIGHIDTGMLIKSLGMDYKDSISFVLHESLAIKKLSIFADESCDADTREESFDAECFLEFNTIRQLLSDLFGLIGIK